MLIRIALLTGLHGSLLACSTSAADPEPEPAPPPQIPSKPPPKDVVPEVTLLDHEGIDALFCVSPVDAASLATGAVGEGCAPALDVGKARTVAESWGRRTGGPWVIGVKLLEEVSDDARCCYEQTWKRKEGARPTKGRLLVEGGQLILPDGPRPGTGAAGAWRQDARLERSAVAAFHRAAAELEATGAPHRLVARTRLAADEEARHARMCLEIAQSLDGQAEAIGAVPAWEARALDIVGVAVTTLLEAALPETLAAEEARVAATRCTTPMIRAALETIATEEQSHADLAWSVIGWARAVGGPRVDDALVAALESWRPWDVFDEARDDAAGRLGAVAREALVRNLVDAIVVPLTRAAAAA